MIVNAQVISKSRTLGGCGALSTMNLVAGEHLTATESKNGNSKPIRPVNHISIYLFIYNLYILYECYVTYIIWSITLSIHEIVIHLYVYNNFEIDTVYTLLPNQKNDNQDRSYKMREGAANE